jgi:hypothetical protein
VTEQATTDFLPWKKRSSYKSRLATEVGLRFRRFDRPLTVDLVAVDILRVS